MSEVGGVQFVDFGFIMSVLLLAKMNFTILFSLGNSCKHSKTRLSEELVELHYGNCRFQCF